MTDAIIMYIDGVRTRASGDVVLSLSVDQSQAAKLQRLMTLVGKPIGVAFADIEKTKPKKGPYGQQARALKQSSFFRTPEVWKVIGSDEEFRKWVQEQPSALTGDQDSTINGPRCEAAHVRRAGESGTSYKAPYSCVPLTHLEHQYQHQKGELEAIWKYADELRNKIVDVEGAKEWFDKQRIKYVSDWCWQSLKKQMGYDSWSYIPPNDLYQLALNKGIDKYLPKEYTEK